MNRIKLIGILTIVAGVVGVISPPSIGGWVALIPQEVGIVFLYAMVGYVVFILSVIAIVFGITTLLRKMWVWKANLILQIILIPFLTATLLSALTITSWSNFRFLPINSILVFAISITVLLLLARPKTRDQFQSLRQ